MKAWWLALFINSISRGQNCTASSSQKPNRSN